MSFMLGVEAFLVVLAAVMLLLGVVIQRFYWIVSMTAKKAKERDDHTDQRVDQIWEANLRRGETEALTKKLVVDVPEEPMTLVATPQLKNAFAPIKRDLMEFRKALKTDKPGQVAEAIEKKYGAWIAKHICRVLGVSDYACLRMALLEADDSFKTPDPDSPTPPQALDETIPPVKTS